MNIQLRDITVTARDGRVSHLDQVYIRGSHVRFFIVPDMLRNAPMFRQKDRKGKGVGLARGKATVGRARGQRPSGRGWLTVRIYAARISKARSIDALRSTAPGSSSRDGMGFRGARNILQTRWAKK